MIKQTRIFVPLSPLYDYETWAETVFGRIIKPAVKNSAPLNWFWLSRYYCTREVDSGDCNIQDIPPSFIIPQDRCYRSIRFRYSIEDPEAAGFERTCQNLIDSNDCIVSDFRDYDLVGDLGSNRHIGGDRDPRRRERRAEIIAKLYYAISLLTLDALIGPDQHGRFRFEDNDSGEAPNRSSFSVPHHIFCNITNVPLRVLLSGHNIGTDFYPPANPVSELRIRF